MPEKNLFILVVDDERLVSEVIQAHVANQDYDELSLDNAEEALDYFEENSVRVDIAIIDLTLPGMSGIELAESFLEMKPELCLVLVTGILPESIPADKKALFHKIIYKPFQKADVIDAIESSVGKVCMTAKTA